VEQGAEKVFVRVVVAFDEVGAMRPLTIDWEDGRKFFVDRVLEMRKAASLKAGGAGLRYTCRIGRRDAYLFYEGGRWFVEAKTPQACGGQALQKNALEREKEA